MKRVDPVELSLFLNRAAFVAEEMGVVLERAAFSPNIKDRRDFSCAVFHATGRLIGQASHIPVHLGAMPELMAQLLTRFRWKPGDIAWSNDPTAGGTHLPDISLVQPVFVKKSRVGFVMCRAHHSDVGGICPGSMPLASELAQEGVCIPPQLLARRGDLQEQSLALLLRNVRTPEERQGDLAAQIAACATGAVRFAEMVHEFTTSRLGSLVEASVSASRSHLDALLRGAQPGVYSASDTLELPSGERLPLALSVSLRRKSAVVDFTRMPSWIPIGLNAPRAVCQSAAYYVFWALALAASELRREAQGRTGSAAPVRITQGSFAPISFRFRPGSLCDPPAAAPIAAGNVETSQRLVDLLLQALQPAFPQFVPACSQGTMNNIALGGIDPSRGGAFAYYETMGGGIGAHPLGVGASAMHSHMSNTRNSSIEELESHIPVRVTRYEIARCSGGVGRYCGGDGLVRELQALADLEFSVLSQRRSSGPPGCRGGSEGSPGRNVIIEHNKSVKVPGLASGTLRKGDKLRIQSPGGGGWGSAGKLRRKSK